MAAPETPDLTDWKSVFLVLQARHGAAKSCAKENATYIPSRSCNGAKLKGPGGYFASFRKYLKVN